MTEWFLKMWYGICSLFDDIVYLSSLTFINTNHGLNAARNLARYRQKKRESK